MGKVIAIANEKGGVAKTTSTKNIAVGLAKAGKKVLAIDIDPSANLTASLGVEINKDTGSICDVYCHFISDDEDENYKRGIYHQEEGIDIIPSESALYKIKEILNTVDLKEIILKDFINSIKDEYDYIIIDCPAGSDILPTNALYAADELIIPMQPHTLSVDALTSLLERLKRVRKKNGAGKKPEIMGVLFTMVRPETNNDCKIIDWLKTEFGDRMYFFNAAISLSTKFPRSDEGQASIFKFAPNSSQAIFYSDLIDEILRLEKEN